MPTVPDTSHLPWWLGPTKAPWEAMIEGIHAGALVRSNQIRTQQVMAETEQNLQRQETNTQLKLMDLHLESDRNDLAKQAFSVRQNADLTRAKGMTEIGEFLGNATKENKLTDPETQAGFWNLTSKYAPFIPETAVNSMWDNTFKAAMDRKDKAEGVSKESTALKQNSAYFQKLDKDVSDAIANEEEMADLGTAEEQTQAASLRETAVRNKELAFRIAGVIDPEAGVKLKTAIAPDGREFHYIEGRRGEIQKILPNVESKILNPLKLARYKSQMRMLEKMVDGYSPQILGPDKKPDAVKIEALATQHFNEAMVGEPVKPGAAAPAPTGTNAPTMRFDPATRKLVPLQ